MRKIRLLVLAAVFALAGFSIASCSGKSPSGTATVPQAATALGTGVTIGVPFDNVNITIALADVTTAETWTAGENAITWLKWKATADGEVQAMAADTIGGITVTATPSGKNKDGITVGIKSTTGAQKVFDGILTEIEIPADKLSSNKALGVKLGDNGVHLKFVNGGAKAEGQTGIVMSNGITADGTGDAVEIGRVAYSVTAALDLTKLVPQNNNNNNTSLVSKDDVPVVGTPDITSCFPGLSGKHIVAKLLEVDSTTSTKKLVIGFFTEAGSNAPDATNKPTAGVIESAFEIPGAAYGDDTTGAKITIADAVKIYIPAANRKAATDQKTVSGQAGLEIDPVEVTITLTGDYIRTAIDASDEDFNIADFISITGLPNGIKLELVNSVEVGAGSFKVRISGTPAAEGAYSKGRIQIIHTYLASDSGITIEENAEENKLTLSFKATPAGTITAPANTSADTGNIKGIVGTALKTAGENPADYEITIELPNDVQGLGVPHFAAIAADTVVAGTGLASTEKSWIPDLPAGLSAKIKTALTAESTSATLTITGTPTSACSKTLRIEVPGNKWTVTHGNPATTANADLILVAEGGENQKWAIAGAASFIGSITGTRGSQIRTNTTGEPDGQDITVKIKGDKFKSKVKLNENDENATDLAVGSVITRFFDLGDDQITAANGLFTDGAQDPASTFAIKVKTLPTYDATTNTSTFVGSVFGTPAVGFSVKLEDFDILGDFLESGVKANAGWDSANQNSRFDIGPAAYIEDVTISGTREVEWTEAVKFTIKLVGFGDNSGFKALATNAGELDAKLKGWITNLNAISTNTNTITVGLDAALENNAKSATLTLTGTPNVIADGTPIQVAIPIGDLNTDLEDESIPTTPNADAKWSIVAANNNP